MDVVEVIVVARFHRHLRRQSHLKKNQTSFSGKGLVLFSFFSLHLSATNNQQKRFSEIEIMATGAKNAALCQKRGSLYESCTLYYVSRVTCHPIILYSDLQMYWKGIILEATLSYVNPPFTNHYTSSKIF